MREGRQHQGSLYRQACVDFGGAIARLAHAYEADAEQRRDLIQEIHFALWRSFEGYAAQCSLRTWVYRVAHNVGVSKRLRVRRPVFVDLEHELVAPADQEPDAALEDARAVARLHALIRRLEPHDAQVMLLYLEDLDAASIGEITGLSARAVATRIHRIKTHLSNTSGPDQLVPRPAVTHVDPLLSRQQRSAQAHGRELPDGEPVPETQP